MCLTTKIKCMFCENGVWWHFGGAETRPEEVRLICHECLKKIYNKYVERHRSKLCGSRSTLFASDLLEAVEEVARKARARGFTIYFYAPTIEEAKICCLLSLTENAWRNRNLNYPNCCSATLAERELEPGEKEVFEVVFRSSPK